MSQVLYARLPDDLKEATDVYAGERGATLTRTVVELLRRGLTAVADEPSIEALQGNLGRLRAEKEQMETELLMCTSRTAGTQDPCFACRQHDRTLPQSNVRRRDNRL